jgi:kumamolisin
VPAPRRIPLPGSERAPLAGAVAVGPSDAAERIEVTLRLRPRTPLPDVGGDPAALISRAELGERHGAAPRDVAAVEAFAARNGLDIVSARPEHRAMVLGGSTAELGRAFGVELQRWEHAGGSYRGRTGPLHLPPRLASAVEGVFGLDDRPQAQPHFRRRAARSTRQHHSGGFTPLQVARLYDFPRQLDGSGETIALLEVSGGYHRPDLDAYFDTLGLRTPRLVDVHVDHGRNLPVGDPDSDDSEVLLDIEVAGAVAPGARLAVYWTPNTERGFIDALAEVVHDATLRPSVLSISWGSAEATWTGQAMRVLDGLFQSAAAVGVTVLAASGDNGSHDGVHDGRAHVDFPASSPHVLACGGTRLHLHRDGALAEEEAWNDGPHHGATGGGISDVFAVPEWQQQAGLPRSANPGHRPGRGVPDVAGDADPDTGYTVRVDGQDTVIGGTSAVAPLWAGLVAMANQRRGRPLGLLTPTLYGAVRQAGGLRDVATGSNGAYTACAGWDACTGLGTPNGARLLDALISARMWRTSQTRHSSRS